MRWLGPGGEKLGIANCEQPTCSMLPGSSDYDWTIGLNWLIRWPGPGGEKLGVAELQSTCAVPFHVLLRTPCSPAVSS